MTDDYLVGTTVAGKYRVEKVLGKGGMGLVVGARHLRLDEPVAIKILRRDMIQVAGMVTRFLREARAASKIKSEHVARVMDVDTLEDGTPYMVMEYLEGIDFSELRKAKGTFEVATAACYLVEACEAIAEAHSLGIIHRDLKPSNLFLARKRDGRDVVKVLDFGISKLPSEGEGDPTQTGTMMGSPKYMSPEQMLSMSDVDTRSDIWSLGAILYEFLAGRPPFLADTTPRVCALVLAAEPAPPSKHRPGLPREIEAIVLRCLQKDRNRRISTITELSDALMPFAVGRASLPGDGLLRLSVPMPPPTPASGDFGATVVERVALAEPWDAATRPDLAPPKKRLSRARRVAAAVIAGVTLSGLGVAYALQHRLNPTLTPDPPLSPVLPELQVPPVSLTVVVPSETPTVDVAPPTPPKPPRKAVKPAVPVVSPKDPPPPKKPDDPFDWRRH